eukprot:CAMPEP_0170544624 /NCGR_PEP_ID=MMETSP0211-20121228/3311_1 /TAXON_ID=311385 /ORGANISM="Pseudokeronopsis sp., Strain OXSARD2" /LENGTH=43 /DNA_ID= /DNA_START= /DNA_END= /DNA_ORIENTATION=
MCIGFIVTPVAPEQVELGLRHREGLLDDIPDNAFSARRSGEGA